MCLYRVKEDLANISVKCEEYTVCYTYAGGSCMGDMCALVARGEEMDIEASCSARDGVLWE